MPVGTLTLALPACCTHARACPRHHHPDPRPPLAPSPRHPPDADKRNALEYFDTLLALVRPGGLIAFDNALFYGRVADDTTDDPGARGMRAFEDALMADARVSTVLLPVGDGTLLIRKK